MTMVAGRLVGGNKGSHSAPVLVHRNLSPTTMQSPLLEWEVVRGLSVWGES